MKKIICMVMVLAMMLGLSAQTALAAAGDTAVTKQTAVVQAKTPLYKNAETNARRLTLSKGKVVTVTAENGDRYKVTYGKKTGYVIKGKLKLIPNDVSISEQAAKTSAKTPLYKNVYSSSKLKTLKKNTKLTLIAENGKYYKVKYGKKTGYVLKSKITPADSAPVVTPTPEMEVLGSGFNNEVLAAVNESRADYGNGAMTLDSGLCAKALAHAKEMALQGKIFHSCGGAESVSNSTESGRCIGIRSAAHATGLALDADRSRLGVGSVKYNGVQYTCVFSPRD